ncbi:MAG: hypothetical protein R2707_14725 [Acidimicrobiales bacterium]
MRRMPVIAVLITVALLAGACGDDADTSSPTTTPSTTTVASTTTADATTTTTEATTTTVEAAAAAVELVSYPFWDNDVAAEAPDALDELAAAYVAGLGADEEPEMERFLFGDLPVTVFDEVFEGTTPERRQELMWMMWVSGYFGGRWLRGEIADAQPEAPLVGFSNTPTEESFAGTIGRASDRLASLEGDDAAILEAARAALFDRPPAEEGGDPIRGLADNFGYNRGYLEEILNTPPEGVEASPQFQVNCGGLFDCVYTTPKLAVLEELGDFQALLNSENPPDPELVAELLPVQEAAIPRGVSVWSGGLSVQGFSQESYDQLLDVSSSFLETVQAAALINARAVAEDDVAAAQTGLVAEAVMIVWLEAYRAGLTNGEGVIELPTFS